MNCKFRSISFKLYDLINPHKDYTCYNNYFELVSFIPYCRSVCNARLLHELHKIIPTFIILYEILKN